MEGFPSKKGTLKASISVSPTATEYLYIVLMIQYQKLHQNRGDYDTVQCFGNSLAWQVITLAQFSECAFPKDALEPTHCDLSNLSVP